MPQTIKITIDGTPIAQQRPRFTNNNSGRPRSYNAQATEAGKFLILASQQIKEKFVGACVMTFLFVFPRPKNHFGAGKNSNKLKPSAPIDHTKKPDLDNLIKFVMDCLNNVAYVDDAQVVEIVATKRYASAVDDTPRTEVIIKTKSKSDKEVDR